MRIDGSGASSNSHGKSRYPWAIWLIGISAFYVWDCSCRIFCLRPADPQLPFPIPARLLAHEDGAALDVQVKPWQSYQLTFADTRDQFQIEHRQNAVLFRLSESSASIDRLFCLRRKGDSSTLRVLRETDPAQTLRWGLGSSFGWDHVWGSFDTSLNTFSIVRWHFLFWDEMEQHKS